jgi:hypothetical protein
MTRRKVLGLLSLLSLGTVAAATAQPSTVHAEDQACATLAPELAKDPATSDVFTVLDSKNLYRFQERPYVRLPVGVKLKLRAPQGVSEADLHRAAVCTMQRGADAGSPLAVPGSALKVKRQGGHYELHITAADQGAAREIQRRAEALRK